MAQWVSKDGQGAAEADLRYDPVLITTWWGVVDRGVVDSLFDVLDGALRKAQSERRRVVTVSYVAQPGMPNAVVRKHMAERARRGEEMFSDVTVGSVVVIQSDVSRVALKAIQWLLDKGDSMIVVGTLAEAFKKAGDLMEAAGERRPRMPDPQGYRPTSPLARSA